MHELVIRGGTVVDGTGAPAVTADVAVDGGRITAVGAVDERGERELDADGLVVAPGWVDIRNVVAQSVRGLGVGRGLSQETFALALEMGLEKLVVQMTIDQVSGIALFEGRR